MIPKIVSGGGIVYLRRLLDITALTGVAALFARSDAVSDASRCSEHSIDEPVVPHMCNGPFLFHRELPS